MINTRDYTNKGKCSNCELVESIASHSLRCLNCDIQRYALDYKQALELERERATYFKAKYEEIKYGRVNKII